MKKPLPDHQKGTEHLAAERTFLAWIRTSIAVISLGFVIAKFGVWLRELAAHLDPQMPQQGGVMSLPIGVAMMAFGGLISVLAAWHFHRLSHAIDCGEGGAESRSRPNDHDWRGTARVNHDSLYVSYGS